MEEILARRFAPFNFSAIPGFPNDVPSMNEWGDYLPRFREREEDNPAQHLSEFHELMHQWEIHHEDVLLKMFMFSLAGDARKWYHSLPPASISSLSEFHAAFTAYCQRLYPPELICHNCCEGYHKSIQEKVVSDVSCGEDPDDLDQESVLSPPHSSASGEVMELIKSITARFDRWEAEQYAEDFPSFEAEALSSSTEGDYEKSFPTGPVYGHYESNPWENQEEEILPDMIMSKEGCDDEGCKDRRLGEEVALSELMISLIAQHARLESEDNGEDFPVTKADVLDGSLKEMIEDFVSALASAPDELAVSDQSDEVVVGEEDCSLFLHEISHDVFTFGIEKEDLEIVPFLQDEEVWCSPSFNDYSVEEQQSPTSQIDDLGSSQPVYDSYESGSELDTQNFQEKTAEPSPLFTNERQCEEISPPEQQIEKQSSPTGPIYDDYDSDPWESQEEVPEEPEEQSKMQFTDCAEPVSEQPPPEISEPISVIHPPVLIRDIRPQVNNCVAEEVYFANFLELATHLMTLSANTWSGISPMPWSRPISSQLQPVRRS
jgi:hypothetical protein